MTRIFILTILLALLPSTLYAGDGDSFIHQGIEYRLHGIDAPEYKQACNNEWEGGREATDYLKHLMGQGSLRCTHHHYDKYNRSIATCYVGDLNLNQAMVRSGHAFAYRYFTKKYVTEEEEAKKAGRGVHRYNCENPYYWRKRNRRK